MKIHKQGIPIGDAPPYWVGVRMVCHCGCVFELERGDKVTLVNERHPGGRRTVSATCPTEGCRSSVTADLNQRG